MFRLLCLLTAYIIISSTCIGFFVLESENKQLSTLQSIDYKGDLITLNGNIPLNMFISSEYSTNNLNFVDNDVIGECLQIAPVYTAIGIFSPIDNSVYIRGIESDNNIYTVSYEVYNPSESDFSIISLVTNPNWFNGHKKILLSKFENIGTSSQKLQISFVEDSSLNYAITAPLFISNDLSAWNTGQLNKITTVFNKNTNVFSLFLNDILIASNIPVNYGNDEIIMYGGLRLEEDSTIYLKNIQSKVYLTEDKENSQDLLKIIAQLLAWNVDEKYMPSILNLALIKVPLLFLTIALALYIRGVS